MSNILELYIPSETTSCEKSFKLNNTKVLNLIKLMNGTYNLDHNQVALLLIFAKSREIIQEATLQASLNQDIEMLFELVTHTISALEYFLELIDEVAKDNLDVLDQTIVRNAQIQLISLYTFHGKDILESFHTFMRFINNYSLDELRQKMNLKNIPCDDDVDSYSKEILNNILDGATKRWKNPGTLFNSFYNARNFPDIDLEGILLQTKFAILTNPEIDISKLTLFDLIDLAYRDKIG